MTKTPLSPLLFTVVQTVKAAYHQSGDVNVRELKLSGHSLACITLENMVNKQILNDMLLKRLVKQPLKKAPMDCFIQIEDSISTASEQKRVHSYEELYDLLGSGFAVLVVDGVALGLALGFQGFPVRSVQPSENEVMERASNEAFIEVLKLNTPLLRRRLKTKDLVIKNLKVGKETQTAVAVCYLKTRADARIVKAVEQRLQSVEMDTVLESGYLQPFLEADSGSLFPSVGVSDRPDTVCAKLGEGRVAVLVDGSPFCMITPFLFSEHFQSMDDYTMNPYFATFIRILKYLSFFLAILLPGFYVAIGEHNPEVFPSAIFFKVVDAEVSTPFSLLFEALLIHTIYEIMREAGLRLPKSVGHAVSIVGALVIGESAVTAGLIGAPMIIVVAVTALASYVIPSLYYPAAILRFAFIIVGGISGLFGVVLLFSVVLIQITALNAYGIPISAPISPLDWRSMRDTVVRMGWKTLSKRTALVQQLHGVQEGSNDNQN